MKDNILLGIQDTMKQQRQLFGERLRMVRKNAGLTQKQLAEKAGMPASVIARYEAGGTLPRQKAIEQLAAALNIDSTLLDPGIHGAIIDIELLKRNGVNVSYDIATNTFTLSLPGYPVIKTSDTNLLNYSWDSSEQDTEKAMAAAKEKLLATLFMQYLYHEILKES